MGNNTGSLVNGTVPGLNKHLGGGAKVMFINGNPSGLLTVPLPGVGAGVGVSGAILAFDASNNAVYQNNSGTNWLQIGSQAFS